eukprot:CAMPEP_0174241340 /NCGR_PEP_ID=MMETSP0417-20130205/22917_1 /TAXON_ID=242541 /ORGANISM="Mayorella sp, Strain BSH-02190019" /LENGTH=87 /DNA_ID=CAMNT_0015320567 /DNA_START=65 /DNA_END=325 /DNA_ORIENTATION=+
MSADNPSASTEPAVQPGKLNLNSNPPRQLKKKGFGDDSASNSANWADVTENEPIITKGFGKCAGPSRGFGGGGGDSNTSDAPKASRG